MTLYYLWIQDAVPQDPPKIKKKLMTRLTPKLHSLMTLVSPKSLKCNISMNNGQIALKFSTEVQSQ